MKSLGKDMALFSNYVQNPQTVSHRGFLPPSSTSQTAVYILLFPPWPLLAQADEYGNDSQTHRETIFAKFAQTIQRVSSSNSTSIKTMSQFYNVKDPIFHQLTTIAIILPASWLQTGQIWFLCSLARGNKKFSKVWVWRAKEIQPCFKESG